MKGIWGGHSDSKQGYTIPGKRRGEPKVDYPVDVDVIQDDGEKQGVKNSFFLADSLSLR